MVSVKHIEEVCECGSEEGTNSNCFLCKSYAEARTIGEIPIRPRK